MSTSRTLLAASAGGHLTQLWTLVPRLSTTDPLWASYDVPAARSIFGESMIAVHHPTTKHLPNALRNYQVARHVFRSKPIEQVISTGAAIAVPFLLRAHQLGIPAHYIESATRVSGPSLTGRMLERLPRVHLYRQHGGWGTPRWHQGPNVFDGYGVDAADGNAAIGRLVVSLGTHGFEFPRLINSVGRQLDGIPNVDVLWQLGATSPSRPLAGCIVKTLPAEDLAARIRAADVVVGHAGVGLALTALAAGKVPVLVPRRHSRGEHTDDHQVELAGELERRGLAVTAEVGELSREHLERAAALQVHYEPPPPFELID